MYTDEHIKIMRGIVFMFGTTVASYGAGLNWTIIIGLTMIASTLPGIFGTRKE